MQRSARVWLVCLTSFIFRRAFAQHKNVHRAYWHKRSGKLLVIIGTGQPPWPCSRGQSGETRGMNSKGLCQNSFTHFSRFETVRKSRSNKMWSAKEKYDTADLTQTGCCHYCVYFLWSNICLAFQDEKVNGNPLLTSETVLWPTWPYYFYCEY